MKVSVIKGKKVVLRPLSLRDALRFCKWFEDPEVTMFINRHEDPPTLKEERDWIAREKRRSDGTQFAIDTKEGKHIGICGLLNIDQEHKHAEFGIFIGDKEYWGQGHGTEATKLIVHYGFSKLKLHRIHLQHFDYNSRGHNTYKRVGFKVEGRLRQHRFRNGHYHDMIIMGLMKNEFKK